jgi:uncharacterized protein
MIGSLTIHLHLPGCASLKEKRGRILHLMSRLRREFNISVAETDLRDAHQESLLVCAMVNSDRSQLERSLRAVEKWIAANWPDGDVVSQRVEIF